MAGESRTIKTEVYVEGGVSGGNVAGRDININNENKMTKEEFLQLLQTFKEELTQSGLPNDDIEIIEGDLKTVETQLEKDEPKKSIVTRKINSINGMLEDANEAVENSNELFIKLVATGQLLASGLSLFA